MSIIDTLKESIEGESKASSKRIIMYLFVIVAMFMVFCEATFNLILMYKWINGKIDVCVFKTVFSLGLYGYVFGIIGALAGINGFIDKIKAQYSQTPEA